MAPAKKQKEKSGRKARPKRTVRVVNRQANQNLKMNWVLSAETRKKKQCVERVKACKERKRAKEILIKKKKK